MAIQYLESAVCYYSCWVWRLWCQRLPTKGICDHSVPAICAFALIIPFIIFCLFSFFPQCHLSILYLLKQTAFPPRPLPPRSPPTFVLQNNQRANSVLSGSMFRCFHIEPEQRHDLFGAELPTIYTLLALWSEGRAGRGRHGENVSTISRILAARQ